ncbi:hypothetical protein [Vineibacter terrae]|nr:hypothetical protein [Vineibacter terrae]
MLRDWFIAYAQDRYIRTGYDIVRYGSRIASVMSLLVALGIVSYVMFLAD